MLAAPTLLAHGAPALVEALVPAILDGRHGWCQLFSEPVAGSNLAGLRTRAVRDGDELVVTGQKVWTSLGQWADYGILIARTDPDAPKHRGITYFAFPMRQDGVEVRPLREMTGRSLFNEVFVDEARVPHDHAVGGRLVLLPSGSGDQGAWPSGGQGCSPSSSGTSSERRRLENRVQLPMTATSSTSSAWSKVSAQAAQVPR